MQKVRSLLFLVLGLLIAALVTRNSEVAWMMLPFLLYMAWGIFLSPADGQIHVEAIRSVQKRERGGTPLMEMSITLRNRSRAMIHLSFSDPLKPGMRLAEGRLQQSIALQAGEEVVCRYAFQTERGIYAWDTICARVSDSFGLVSMNIELPAKAEIRVAPELRRFQPFSLRPQSTLHSAGSIPARLGGSGTDFWGIREYHPGDPLRRLDWRMTARHPHLFFTKEFEQEEIADIGLILDVRRKSDVRAGGSSLFEHTARATASLAEVFLRQGNRVSLLLFQKKSAMLYPGYGKRQLHRILTALAQVTPEEDGSLSSLPSLPTHMFSRHALLVVLSPLLRGDWRLFPRLQAYGYRVLLVCPDPIAYAQPFFPSDRITPLALRLIRMERQLEIQKISRMRIPVIDWQVGQPLSLLVRNALTHTLFHRDR
jgi:uncharacterized protein (DUF58 family)